MHYVGIDLGCSAQSGRLSSAVAILNGNGQLSDRPTPFRRADELVAALSQYDREGMVMAVDAPRSVPDHAAENYAYRSCEKAIKKIDPHAGTFSGAAALFIRWYEIEQRHFRRVKVIETYPRVIWARLQLPGKARDFARNKVAVYEAVERITGIACDGLSHHQIDALLCAYTAFCYDGGKVELYGDAGEGLIVIPAPRRKDRVPPGPEQITAGYRRFPSMRRTGGG